MNDVKRARLIEWLEKLGCEVTGEGAHRTLFHATVKDIGEATVFERAAASPRFEGWPVKAIQRDVFTRFRDAGFDIKVSTRRLNGNPARVYWLMGVWQRSKRLQV